MDTLGPEAEKAVVLKSVTKDLVNYFLSKGIRNYTAPADIDWVRADDVASRNSLIFNGTDIIPNSTKIDTGQERGSDFIDKMGEDGGFYHWLVLWFHSLTKVGE